MRITHAARLTNTELIAEVTRLARGEREATVALIVHLAEFDARRLYEGAGFSSTFKYCLAVLRLSEDAAFNRIEAARAARRYPVVLDMLSAGTLSPTTLRMLARHLTRENHTTLLAAASGKTKQEVERVLAGFFPQPDVPDSIRKVPSGRTSSIPEALPVAAPSPGAQAPRPPKPPSPLAPIVAMPPAARSVVRPLTPERYEIRFTASAETREKLRRAQDLLGHAIPSGDLAQVIDRALTLLVADLERKKFAETRRPRRSRGQAEDSRNIPADVRRAVRKRDRDRCAYVAETGRRCNETRCVEFHHCDEPYGIGGKPTVENIQLRCRAHNRHAAELFYGPIRGYTPGDPSPVPERVTGMPANSPPIDPGGGPSRSP